MASSSELPSAAGGESVSGLVALSGLVVSIAPWVTLPDVAPWPEYLNAFVGVGAAAVGLSAAYVVGRVINAVTIRCAPGRAAAYDDLQATARRLSGYEEWAQRATRLQELPLGRGTASQTGSEPSGGSWVTPLKKKQWKRALFAPTLGTRHERPQGDGSDERPPIPELYSIIKAELIAHSAEQYADVQRIAGNPAYAIRNLRGGVGVAGVAMLTSGVLRFAAELTDNISVLLTTAGSLSLVGGYLLGKMYTSTLRQEFYQTILRLDVQGVVEVESSAVELPQGPKAGGVENNMAVPGATARRTPDN